MKRLLVGVVLLGASASFSANASGLNLDSFFSLFGLDTKEQRVIGKKPPRH